MELLPATPAMFFCICWVVVFAWFVLGRPARARARSLMKPSDPRGEFVRLCAPQMAARWEHPESVCGCLHDYVAAAVEDVDLRPALLRGIGETGVPTIEIEWAPASKRFETGADAG